MVIDPWGEILAEAEEEETILSAQIDFTAIEEVRTLILFITTDNPVHIRTIF